MNISDETSLCGWVVQSRVSFHDCGGQQDRQKHCIPVGSVVMAVRAAAVVTAAVVVVMVVGAAVVVVMVVVVVGSNRIEIALSKAFVRVHDVVK